MLEHLVTDAQKEAYQAYQLYRQEQFNRYANQVTNFIATAAELTVGPRIIRPARDLEFYTMFGRKWSPEGRPTEAMVYSANMNGRQVGIGYSSIYTNPDLKVNIACGAMATTASGVATTMHSVRELGLGILAGDQSQILQLQPRMLIHTENMNTEASQQFLRREDLNLSPAGQQSLASLISAENNRWHRLFGEDGYFGYDGGGNKICKPVAESLIWGPQTIVIEENGTLKFSDYDQFEITTATMKIFNVPTKA